MKIGVISDIHANPFGLETALNQLTSNSVDLILCAGDLTGYSPLVNETLDLLTDRPIEFILGNHDFYLLNGCPPSKNKIVQKSVSLTRQIIKPEFINFLASLKLVKIFDIQGIRIKMIHGSPSNALEEYIYPDHVFNPEKLRLDSENLLILGHTHHQMIKQFKNFEVLNPGSSGQPRDGKGYACYALIDTSDYNIELRRIKYNTTDMIKVLTKEKWPPELLKYF